ncbi:MAG: ornithine decarboxylase [Gemmatimonadaceae bacterium]|nr:ornithine decarboxylase [Gemmatimonadaceae bacterium]
MSPAPSSQQAHDNSEPLYNLRRTRTDNWNRLRDVARRLHRGVATQDEADRLDAMCGTALAALAPLEPYFAFPGHRAFARLQDFHQQKAWDVLSRQTIRLNRLLTTGAFRRLDLLELKISGYSDLLDLDEFTEDVYRRLGQEKRPYFVTLVVDELTAAQELELQNQLRRHRRSDDEFVYETIVARTFEDAVMAVLANPAIQAVVARYSFPFANPQAGRAVSELCRVYGYRLDEIAAMMPGDRTLALGRVLRALRPELDLFLVSDAPVEDVVGARSRQYRRVFYHAEDYQDLHLSILKGVHERYDTPFFTALRKYSLKPTGVFHALPISRGKSVNRSVWVQDLVEFYGARALQAETSATSGGLDSLLQPVGPIKRAQELAARAFGARRTYFVTNGTSTANKIVMQALMQPGDIVLLSHDCHKSHPYAVILAGAYPVYLSAYPLSQYSMYGAVPLREIKQQLLRLKAAGKLHKVKLLLLTSITFDGLTYDPMRVMEEVLAIKPDMVFLWDEAWFAYGRFVPTLRLRTAMDAARRLKERLDSPAYRAEYAAWRQEFDAAGGMDEAALDSRLRPDPDTAQVRVYATQSTHKTLTSLRQGSMIHVADQEFEHRVRTGFDEAYLTHTSTSPNYQILASLDAGRRQVELEGYEIVRRSLQLAMTLRERIRADPALTRYFRILGPREMIPDLYRPSGLDAYFKPETGWQNLEPAWAGDEFVLDPTRVTVDVGRTGLDGDQFKQLLMNTYDIQINKTSRNTVLFMVHIGMSRGAIAHLVSVLSTIAEELDDRLQHAGNAERSVHDARVRGLIEELPPLPDFSRFHPAFLQTADSTTPEGDMRTAFYLAYDDAACEFVTLDRALSRSVAAGRTVVCARFVTPYPPGFPVLVPGQVVTSEILDYLLALDVKEIHGYEPDYGLRVFTNAALDAQLAAKTAGTLHLTEVVA